MIKVLIIDNYDSFVYNIAQYLGEMRAKIIVMRNDISLKQAEKTKPDKIVLSPGPGQPKDSKVTLEILKTMSKGIPTLGVCLGHQAIAEVFGGKLINLDKVYHGVATTVSILDDNELLFKDLPGQFKVGRYHSWVIDRETLPECFKITSEDDKGIIMSITHKEYALKGVQFHPESVLTENGMQIIANWLVS